MYTNFTQRWRHGKPVFQVKENCFNPRIHDIDVIDEKTAKDFVLNMHYSKSFPASRRRFGLFRRGTLIGVAVFSHPMSDKVLTNFFGGAATESLELGRFVISDLADDFNSESWFFAQCRRKLKDEGFRGVVSFCDDMRRTNAAGEAIYGGHLCVWLTAVNAVYTGRSERTSIRLLPDGTVFSKRAISKINNAEQGYEYACKILTNQGADTQPAGFEERRLWLRLWLERLTRQTRHPGNHRYLVGLQKSIKLPASLPYPKIKYQDQQLSLL